jgi:nucleoside-diphosphate-sugar epimerase
MGTHVVVGSGAVGSGTALELAGQGHDVLVVTRSGTCPEHPGVRSAAADVADDEAFADLVAGADAIYNCVNPPYHRWPELWPPMAASMLAAAESSGAVLVIMGNLYAYGPVDHPMVESDPLAAVGPKGRTRAAMWDEALAAHRAGRVRVTEARASDFVGPGLEATTHFGRWVAPLLAGRTIRVVGDPDAPHSWTSVADVARTLAVLGTDERAWGRPWHVPTPPPVSQRQLAARFCELADRPAPRIGKLPKSLVRAAGLVVPPLRGLDEVFYQFDRPFVLDSTAADERFGLVPTSLDDTLREVLAGVATSAAPSSAAT